MRYRLCRRMRVLFYNFFSFPKRICKGCSIALSAGIQDATIDDKAAILGGSRFYRSKIGRYSYIGKKCFVESTNVGSFTSIANNCYIGGATHLLEAVSTSPVFHKNDNVFKKNFAKLNIDMFTTTEIGNDVWIGEDVKIKGGVHIGNGAVIGLGSVVTKDVPSYEIWAGNPARFIRKRFDETIIQALLDTEWWNWTDEKLEKLSCYFEDPKMLLEHINDEK